MDVEDNQLSAGTGTMTIRTVAVPAEGIVRMLTMFC